LSFFLKAGVLVVVRMSIGRLFQAAAPATLKARSPNINDVRGMSMALLSADHIPGLRHYGGIQMRILLLLLWVSCGDRL